ncbi:MAG: J domain-containing protein [Alphaproteobacteria bacterium]
MKTSHQHSDDRACDWPGCPGEGAHRAPKDRDHLNDYYWFCIEHVREYNKSWNYFAGMEDMEYETLVRSAATWDRPTWPLGGRVGGPDGPENAWAFFAARDAAAGFADDPDVGIHRMEKPPTDPSEARLGREDRNALATLGLNETASLQDIKKRYKQLVKRYHPDANAAAERPDQAAEERLRAVIQAYSHLVASGLFVNPI